jgi:hypothetical protein
MTCEPCAKNDHRHHVRHDHCLNLYDGKECGCTKRSLCVSCARGDHNHADSTCVAYLRTTDWDKCQCAYGRTATCSVCMTGDHTRHNPIDGHCHVVIRRQGGFTVTCTCLVSLVTAAPDRSGLGYPITRTAVGQQPTTGEEQENLQNFGTTRKQTEPLILNDPSRLSHRTRSSCTTTHPNTTIGRQLGSVGGSIRWASPG